MCNPADQPFFASGEALVEQEQQLLRARRCKAEGAPWLGLALSGGGIRSATFCLGALQALAARGLLHKFDYVSSVSGGGYIACALQWWWSRRNDAGTPQFGSDSANFPYGVNFGLRNRNKISDDILDYLRTHGRYLTPGDGLTVWSGISVVLRTLFLNLFVWLSAATLIFCALLEISPTSNRLPSGLNPFPGIIYARWDGEPHLCGASGIGSAKTLTVSGLKGATAKVVGPQANCVLRYPLSLAPFAWLAYLITLFFIFYSLVLSFMSWVDSPEFAARSKSWQRATTFLTFLASIALTGACAYFANPLRDSAFYDATSLTLIGFSGIGAMLVVTSLLFIITASNYFWRRRFEISAGKCFIYAALLLAFGSVPLIPYYLMNHGGTFSAIASVAVSLLGGLSSAAFGHANQTGKTAGLFTSLLASVGSLIFLYAVLVAAYFLAQLAANTGEIVPFFDNNTQSIVRAAVYSACMIGTVLIFFTNINLVGLHRFYRDRLMEAFMPSEEVVQKPAITYSLEADNLKLTDIWPVTGAAQDIPYPIINTNVILVNDDDATVRLRGGASFMLSPWYVGSDVTGWESAERHARKNGSITLASAMAASGAAANSNAGFVGTGVTRNRIVSVIMGLLNLRLGVWVKTPCAGEASVLSHRPNLFSPGLKYNLLRFGYHRRADYCELSDGGHFDNLGIYELVRRRAKLIVAFDAEADGETNLASLVSVVQRVRDDFDAVIDLERCADHLVPRLDEVLFPPGARWTDAPYFSAPITYRGGERARLIYVKASMFRKLSFLAKAYRAENGDFPHQSTLDQFFDASQFEAYRELGFKSTVAAIEQLKLASYVEDPDFLAGL